MPLHPGWQQITLRILLALIASFFIGLNRDERGKHAGLRTTMLVCLAATLAMLQANILLPTVGKAPDSFVVLDLERLPLGILTGIGFIGTGAILRKGDRVTGLTTAATLWVVTVIGLLFGGGQLVLGSAGSIIVISTLWSLRYFEDSLHAERTATLWLELSPLAPADEAALRSQIASATCRIIGWQVTFQEAGLLKAIRCDLRLVSRRRSADTPAFVHTLAMSPSIARLRWRA